MNFDPILPEERAEPIVVVPYDPAWPAMFTSLRDRIAPALGDLAVGIEHVGSTAVPGLDAKPIIDIDVVIRRADDLPIVAARLEKLGYTKLGDLGIIGREAFRTPRQPPAHHLFVCAAGTAVLQSHLTLRDTLRLDQDTSAAYATLKRDLAQRHRDDRDAYAEGKSAFITSVLRGARDVRRRNNR